MAQAYYEQHYKNMQMYQRSTHYLGNKQDFDVSSETLHYPWIPSFSLTSCYTRKRFVVRNGFLLALVQINVISKQ